MNPNTAHLSDGVHEGALEFVDIMSKFIGAFDKFGLFILHHKLDFTGYLIVESYHDLDIIGVSHHSVFQFDDLEIFITGILTSLVDLL